MLRTRLFQRPHKGGISAQEKCWDATTTNYYGTYNREYTQEYERMIDEGPKWAYVVVDGVRRARYRECFHHKFAGKADLGPVVLRTSNQPLIHCSLDKYRLLVNSLSDGAWQDGFDAALSIADTIFKMVPAFHTHHYERWQRTKPTMASRANLFQFLVELRDIRRLFTRIPNLHFRLTNVPGVNIANWREVLRYANSEHLKFNFGVKPFARDVRETFIAVDSFEGRLDDFVKDADRAISRQRDDEPSSLAGTLVVPRGAAYCTLELEYNITYKLVSCFQYKYHNPYPYGSQEFFWRAYADALGLNVTPGQIWQVLPWSFVVDYFFNVGAYLDSVSDEDWLKPEVVMFQAMSSVSADWSCTAYLRSSGPGGERFPVLYLNGRAFTRKPCFPVHPDLQQELDADKIRLLTSLVASLVL